MASYLLSRMEQLDLQKEMHTVKNDFIVSPNLIDGACLTPIGLQMDPDGEKFYLFGRFNASADTCEFVLTGMAGARCKVSLSDGNNPYGWKVKKHVITKPTPETAIDEVVARCGILEKSSAEESLQELESLQEVIFMTSPGDIISVPYSMIKDAGRGAILDTAEECAGPWSFYGPSSLPRHFFVCHVTVEFSDPPQPWFYI